MYNQIDMFDFRKDPVKEAENLRKKIHRLRCGMFKRYEESQKHLDFLDEQVEDFVKEYLNA